MTTEDAIYVIGQIGQWMSPKEAFSMAIDALEKQKEQGPVHEDDSKPQTDVEILTHYLSWAESDEENCPYTWKRLAKAIRAGIDALNQTLPEADTKAFNDGVKEGRRLEREDMQKEQKTDPELIKQSWYMEGYTDGKFKREPMWNLKTGEGGPRYEKNEKYGQPLEQKQVEWSEIDNIGWDEAFACVTRAEKAAKNEEELQNAVTAEKWLKEIKFKYCVHPVKQKWSEEDELTFQHCLVILHDYGYDNWFKSLRHQLKADWNEGDKKMLEAAISFVQDSPYPYYGDTFRGHIGKNEAEDFLSSLPERFNLQPKQEWSEEDKENLDNLHKLILICRGEKKFIKESEYDKLEESLKSLRPQPQPKQEWSEEDERFLCNLIQYFKGEEALRYSEEKTISWLKALRPQPQRKDTYYDIIHSILAMLKDMDFMQITPEHRVSLLNDIRVKCKNADECAAILDEPHWKPSEEQMKALKHCVDGWQDCADGVLESLYNELKKL